MIAYTGVKRMLTCKNWLHHRQASSASKFCRASTEHFLAVPHFLCVLPLDKSKKQGLFFFVLKKAWKNCSVADICSVDARRALGRLCSPIMLSNAQGISGVDPQFWLHVHPNWCSCICVCSSIFLCFFEISDASMAVGFSCSFYLLKSNRQF